MLLSGTYPKGTLLPQPTGHRAVKSGGLAASLSNLTYELREQSGLFGCSGTAEIADVSSPLGA